ncbi:uncharacterized protein LJ264_002123 [Porphyrio hochstetteri]
MARRKPGRGGGEVGEGGELGPRSRGSVGAQRNASARPVAVTVRSPGRVSAPPFNPRAGGGNNNSQQPAANAAAAAAAAASQLERARSLRPEKESPPPPSPRPPPQPSRPLAPRRPFPPPPRLSVPGARWRGRPGGEGGEFGSPAPSPAPLQPPRRPPPTRHCPAEGRRGEGEHYVFISGRAGSGRRCRSGRGGVGGKAAGWRLKGAFSARCGRPERGGIRRTGRRGRGGAAAIRGGGGEAGSYRVSVSQKWEASAAKMPPGSAAPLGRRAEEAQPSPPPPPSLAAAFPHPP